MASTLTVDTIVGATTAANVKLPAGHIVQVVSVDMSSQVAVSATPAYTNILSGSITPKFAGSKILVQAVLPNYSNNTSTNAWSNSIYIRLYEQEGSGSDTAVAGYDHPGPQTSMEFAQTIPVLFTSGVKSTIQQYTYSIKGRPTVSGDTHYFGRSADAIEGYSRMVMMEIAQ
jgi:hypothetical protein